MEIMQESRSLFLKLISDIFTFGGMIIILWTQVKEVKKKLRARLSICFFVFCFLFFCVYETHVQISMDKEKVHTRTRLSFFVFFFDTNKGGPLLQKRKETRTQPQAAWGGKHTANKQTKRKGS